MSLYIQVEQSLFTHRKTLRLARLLSLDRCAVVGRLAALWAWCLDNALDGRLSDDIDADVLADVMYFDAALGRPADLLEALLTAGFLDLDDATDPAHPTLCIHDWYEHMGQFIEKRNEQRAASAERMRRMRARHARAAHQAAQEAGQEAAGGAPPSAPPVVDVSDDERRYADVTCNSGVSDADVTPLEKTREDQRNVTSPGQEGLLRERTRARGLAADAAPAGAPNPQEGFASLALSPVAPPAPLPSSPPAPPHTRSSARSSAGKVTPLRAPAAPTLAASALAPTPAKGGVRVPDPVWDACIAVMGSPPTNSVERGKWARGIKALRESLPDPTALAAEIGVRSRRYRARFGTSVPLNPMALAGNWSALATDIDASHIARSSHTSQEGRHHGRSAPYGRSRGAGRSGQSGGTQRPAFGTPEYYAQSIG